jgi:hypothetical protein
VVAVEAREEQLGGRGERDVAEADVRDLVPAPRGVQGAQRFDRSGP